jgi:hypothetical protein
MAGRSCLAILVVLAAAALPVRAETFKWVDEKGVTNYSNKPPPARTKSVQKVEERLSFYESDPYLLRLAAMSAARPDYAQAEWLQRQRLMAMRAGYLDYSDSYYSAPFFFSGMPRSRLVSSSPCGMRCGPGRGSTRRVF